MTLNGESIVVGGDAILSVAGQRVATPAQLADLTQSHKPGDHLRLAARGGHTRTVTVTLENAPAAA